MLCTVIIKKRNLIIVIFVYFNIGLNKLLSLFSRLLIRSIQREGIFVKYLTFDQDLTLSGAVKF